MNIRNTYVYHNGHNIIERAKYVVKYSNKLYQLTLTSEFSMIMERLKLVMYRGLGA